MEIDFNQYYLTLIRYNEEVGSETAFSMILRKNDGKRSIYQTVSLRDNYKESIIELLDKLGIQKFILNIVSENDTIQFNTTIDRLKLKLKEKFTLEQFEKLMTT